jgi:hypothetical protein
MLLVPETLQIAKPHSEQMAAKHARFFSAKSAAEPDDLTGPVLWPASSRSRFEEVDAPCSLPDIPDQDGPGRDVELLALGGRPEKVLRRLLT